ncbi:hypothetical protein EVAR_6582_1 [Eumeta japonica]|uniref:Uncharacterized protein n=1 Tax=Eumeta variegata TaxID=151549 RepID=A0A4C1ST61_EUMVA|nr:hypothetical protein EVAR_6582_1 [Eumeta japonica]
MHDKENLKERNLHSRLREETKGFDGIGNESSNFDNDFCRAITRGARAVGAAVAGAHCVTQPSNRVT